MSNALRGLTLASCLLVFGCDHGTKLAAEAALSDRGPLPLVRGVLDLRYTENHDTAFSLLRTFGVPPMPNLLLLVALLALMGVSAVWLAQRKRLTGMQHAGFALVVAGALGNVVDRALRGYVIDFIHVAHWPVFNVADIAVVIGIVALLVSRRKPLARMDASERAL